MKKNWEVKKLGEVCEINPRRPVISRSDLIPTTFVPMSAVDNIRAVIAHPEQRPYSDVKKGYTFFIENDVIFAKITPCMENGKHAIARNLLDGIGFGSTEFHVIRPNEKIIAEWIWYFVRQPVVIQNATKNFTGTVGQQRVPDSFLKSLQIPLPPLPEQQRLVTILDEVFAALATAKENAAKNLQNARELFESVLQGVFANRGWEERKLGEKSIIEIIDNDRGKNYPKNSDFSAEGFCLFMNTKNVRPDGFDFETTMFISEEKDKLLGKGKLSRNDVVMTTRGTIGNLGIYNDKVKYEHIRTNSGMLIFRPNLKYLIPEYLFEVLRSGIIKSQIKKHVSGAAQPQLPIKTLVNFTFPLSKSIAEQRAIVAKLDALSAETKKLEAVYQQKLANLEELKQSVLRKAFRGEI